MDWPSYLLLIPAKQTTACGIVCASKRRSSDTRSGGRFHENLSVRIYGFPEWPQENPTTNFVDRVLVAFKREGGPLRIFKVIRHIAASRPLGRRLRQAQGSTLAIRGRNRPLSPARSTEHQVVYVKDLQTGRACEVDEIVAQTSEKDIQARRSY